LGWIKFGFGSTLFFVGIGFFIFGWIGHLLDIVYRWQFLMIVGGIIGFIGFLIMKKKLGKVLKGVGKGAWKAAKWTGKQAVGAVGTGLDAQIEKNRTRQDKRNQIIAKMTKHCNFIKELVNKKKYRKAQKAINILKKILKRNKRTLGKNNYEYFMRWVQEMELTIQELTRKPRVTTSNIYDLINNRQKKSNTTNQLALPLAQQPLASPPAQQPLALESKDMRRQREMKEFEKDFKEFTSINLDSKIPIVLIRQIRKKRYKAHRLIKKYKGSDIPYIKERIPTIKEYYQILKNAERDTLNKL
jgi:hypothetical protein